MKRRKTKPNPGSTGHRLLLFTNIYNKLRMPMQPKKLLLLAFMTLCAKPLDAGIFLEDHREYVDWSAKPYNRIVMIKISDYYGTGVYVAPDIILTAAHAVFYDNKGYSLGNEPLYKIILHDNRETVAFLSDFGGLQPNNDWALLRIKDPEFFNSDYFIVSTNEPHTPLENAGFGFVRPLANNEVDSIRQIWTNAEHDYKGGIPYFRDFAERSKNYLTKAGITDLEDINPETGKYRLKSHKNCTFNYCNAFSGNSGSPIFSGDTLYAIVVRSVEYIGSRHGTDLTITPSEKYIDALNKMKEKTNNARNRIAQCSL